MRPIIRTCRFLMPYLSTALLMVELDNVTDIASCLGDLLLTCAVVWVVVIYSLFSGYHHGDGTRSHPQLQQRPQRHDP